MVHWMSVSTHFQSLTLHFKKFNPGDSLFRYSVLLRLHPLSPFLKCFSPKSWQWKWGTSCHLSCISWTWHSYSVTLEMFFWITCQCMFALMNSSCLDVVLFNSVMTVTFCNPHHTFLSPQHHSWTHKLACLVLQTWQRSLLTQYFSVHSLCSWATQTTSMASRLLYHLVSLIHSTSFLIPAIWQPTAFWPSHCTMHSCFFQYPPPYVLPNPNQSSPKVTPLSTPLQFLAHPC